MSNQTKRKKLVILGGGIGALSTALELTGQPDWRDRFESITLYQMGWRLGGKGASGRGANGRIEEHGLHIWMGFYENAFRSIRRVYQELGRPEGTPLATWSDAFKPHSFIVFGERVGDQWRNWPLDYQTNDLVPGDGGEMPTLWSYIMELLEWMRAHLQTLRHGEPERNVADGEHPHHRLDFIRPLMAELKIDVECGELSAGLALLAVAHAVASRLHPDPENHQPEHHRSIADLLQRFVAWLRSAVEHEMHLDDDARRLLIMMELGSITIIGLLADRVLTHVDRIESLDSYDFRQWLARHGASDLVLGSSAVKGLYDLLFAYRNGDTAEPSLSAAVALHFAMRMVLTYKGSIFWKMQAGMGDTIFAPIHAVLKKRGVEFRYFHRVTNLGLSADGGTVDTIDIARQATLKNGTYDPLVDVEGLPCWPSEPLYDQLVEGEAIRDGGINLESFWNRPEPVEEICLRNGVDFDQIVFGISLGSIPFVCRELVAASAKWRDMVTYVETTRTQAMQLWLQPDLAKLGWSLPSAVTDGYPDPLNTWADMSHLLDRESWGSGSAPGNVTYFCATMIGDIPAPDDSDAPARELEDVRRTGRDWLSSFCGALWPHASGSDGCLVWDHLFDPLEREGEARLQAQFFRANIDPSERYVLSVPGSLRHRLNAADPVFTNLVPTGDWIYTGINAGCVEATVISGMLAANAISGLPALEDIIGYRHP